MPVLIALGPCLMMGMATAALYIVHRRFSPTRHAMLWAGACTAGMLQWGLMALQGAFGGAPLHTGPAVDLFGLASVLLLAEGFRVRARRTGPVVLPAVAVVTVALLGLLFTVPAMPIRAAVTPLVSAALFVWMAALAAPSGQRMSATHMVVCATLLAVAAVQMVGALLAIGEQVGSIPTHVPYQALFLVMVEPIVAAIALVTLLLIASDFSGELRRLVQTDPLTGICNREGFEHAARLALDGRRRPLAVAVADIDRFKQVNDRHGHAAGDQALCCVARHLADRLGRDGTVARVGGEEFALLLPGADGAGALARIEPLREGLAGVRIAGQPELRISASFGIAQHAPGDTLATLLERADAALYRSKREGRNRTTLAPDDAP